MLRSILRKTQDWKGARLMKAGDFDRALAHYAALAQKRPLDAAPWIEVARAHFRKGDLRSCRSALMSAAQRKPTAAQTRQILEFTNHRKLASERFHNSHPAFSPDGRWIAFTSARRDTQGDGALDDKDNAGLYLVNARSGEEIRVLDDEFTHRVPQFSPDSSRLVYLSVRKDSNGDGRADFRDPAGLYMKDLNTGREDCLVESMHHPKFPSFSQSGDSVIFTAWHSGSRTCGIYSVDLRTHFVRTLHDDFDAGYPRCSPDGRRVVFAGWKRDTNGDGVIDLRDRSALFELDFSTGRLKERVSDRASNSYPAYSPDGSEILFLSRSRDTNRDGVVDSLDHCAIEAVGATERPRTLVSDRTFNKFPCYAYDGGSVYFVGSWRGKRRGARGSDYFDHKGVYALERKSGTLQEVVSGKYYGSRFLCASPVADQIAYVSWRADTNRGLYLCEPGRLPEPAELFLRIEENL